MTGIEKGSIVSWSHFFPIPKHQNNDWRLLGSWNENKSIFQAWKLLINVCKKLRIFVH